MAVDLSALKVFVRVAELGSFSKAAVSLGSTQPSVSRVISGLEQEFGGVLFHRTGRGVSFTELGEMVFPRARALLQDGEQLATDALGFNRSPIGPVSIGVLRSSMQPLASILYAHVREHAPGIRLRFIEGFGDQIERSVSEGKVDIGILSRYRAHRPSLEEVLFRADLVLVRATGGPPLPDPIEFSRLDGLPLVLPSHSNGLRVLLEETARKHKMALNVVVDADSLSAQKDIVQRCGCYSIMATQALNEVAPPGVLVGSRITKPDLTRLVVMVTSHHRPLSQAGRELLGVIRRTVASGQ